VAVLRDGSEVIIRRLTRADAPVLAEAFGRLSRESRDLRFLGGKPRLSRRELEYLTEVDGHDHEALGAVDAASGIGVGVARFVRLSPGSDVAEVAVTVVDDWQRRGLGTVLLEELTERAQAEGIRRYTALVSHDNEAVMAILQDIGAHVQTHDEGSGTVVYEIELAPVGLGHTLSAALRAAASGRTTVPRRIADALSELLDHHGSLAAGRDDSHSPSEEDRPDLGADERASETT
jgi:GNAT superfamily N-acetyltransferase